VGQLRRLTQRSLFRPVLRPGADYIKYINGTLTGFGHILRKIWLLQQVIEGKLNGGREVTGTRGRRRRKLLDNLKEMRGYSHLKEEAVDHTMWRDRFGPVVGQTAKWTN
jgi:hypothetical protein